LSDTGLARTFVPKPPPSFSGGEAWVRVPIDVLKGEPFPGTGSPWVSKGIGFGFETHRTTWWKDAMDRSTLRALRAQARAGDADARLELARVLTHGGIRSDEYRPPTKESDAAEPICADEEALLDFTRGFRKLSAAVSSSSRRDAARADASYLHARHGFYGSLARLLERSSPREAHARDAVWRDLALAWLADDRPMESLRVLRTLLFYRPSDLVLLLLAAKTALLGWMQGVDDADAAVDAWQWAQAARRQAQEAPPSRALVPLAAQADLLYASAIEACASCTRVPSKRLDDAPWNDAWRAYVAASDVDGPWQAQAWCGLCRCALVTQRLKEAETAAKRALRASGGTCEEAWVLRATVADAMRQPRRAQQVLRAARAVLADAVGSETFPSSRRERRDAPPNGRVGSEVQLAQIRLALEDAIDEQDEGEWEANVASYERIAEQSTTDRRAAELYEELAHAMERMGDANGARKAAERCAERAGQDHLACALRAEASVASIQGDEKEATRLRRAALAVDPSHARTASQVAEALLQGEVDALPWGNALAVQILEDAHRGPWMRDNARVETLLAQARPRDEHTVQRLKRAAHMEACAPRLPLPPPFLFPCTRAAPAPRKVAPPRSTSR